MNRLGPSGRPRRRPGALAPPEATPPAPWSALVAGGAVMGFALVGAVRSLGDDFDGWALWVVGADVAHDAIVAPLACAAGAVVARVAPPGRVRAHVQAGLLASAVVLAVAWIPLRGLGGNPGNPTIRPLDYGSATVTALALVWAAVATSAVVAAAVAAVRSRRAPLSSGGSAP